MAVLTRQFTVEASVEDVHGLVTDLGRLSEFTEISKVSAGSPARITPGARWKNRGATLKIPSWDTSEASEVSENRIRWHTRSMVLGVIPVGADWSITIHDERGRTEVTDTFEHVSMFGLPVGLLIKAPFLPMRWLAYGAMLAGQKKLEATLARGAATASPSA